MDNQTGSAIPNLREGVTNPSENLIKTADPAPRKKATKMQNLMCDSWRSED